MVVASTPSNSTLGQSPSAPADPSKGPAKSPAASPEARTAALLAQLMRYTRFVLAGDSQREVAWRIVSQFSAVLPADRVVLATADGKKVLATNAGATPAPDRPFAQTLRQVAKQQRGEFQPQILLDTADPRPAEQKNAMGGSQLCWLPLVADGDGKTADYALWIERWQGKTWTTQELDLLSRLSPYLQSALQKKSAAKWRKKWPIIIGMALLVIALFPVREHATATAYVEPDQPNLVSAPLNGVIATVLAIPGAQVVQGVPLLQYDQRVFERQLVEAEQAVAVAQAELQRLQAAGYGDLDARAQVSAQQLEVQRLQDQQQFLQQQVELTTLLSPAAGILQIQDAANLQGRSVKIGERLASVVQPGVTRLRLEVPVHELGLLQVGSEVSVRMNDAPLASWNAKITHIGFAVETSADGLPVVQTEACWVDAAGDCASQQSLGAKALASGQQGSARIYAGWTVLGYQILRRPLGKFLALIGV